MKAKYNRGHHSSYKNKLDYSLSQVSHQPLKGTTSLEVVFCLYNKYVSVGHAAFCSYLARKITES